MGYIAQIAHRVNMKFPLTFGRGTIEMRVINKKTWVHINRHREFDYLLKSVPADDNNSRRLIQ